MLDGRTPAKEKHAAAGQETASEKDQSRTEELGHSSILGVQGAQTGTRVIGLVNVVARPGSASWRDARESLSVPRLKRQAPRGSGRRKGA